MNPAFWRDKRVFLTGHTGFKGGWLALWLSKLGASVSGFALAPNTQPNLFELGGVKDAIFASAIADLRDRDVLTATMRRADPEIVFHLAAQPLVRDSYTDPVGTYATNVLGTAHVLEAARVALDLKAVVVVTSDKCYENNRWVWGYRENDRLGGHDPYSSSKACAELVAESYRRSFFQPSGTGTRLATARAGNVIGGGDWSKDRLVPDIVRGCLGPQHEVRLRNPEATRPWQHVLEPLHGYLMLAERLAAGNSGFDEAWNFGPPIEDARPVLDVADAVIAEIGAGKVLIDRDPHAPHEADLLQLDCSKARAKLGWLPKFDFSQAIASTAAWYSAWHRGNDMRAFSEAQIDEYQALKQVP